MNKHKGFTLAEILISLAIIGGVITAALGIFIIGSTSMKQSRTQRDVTWIMEKKLSEVKHLYTQYPYDKYPSGPTQAEITDIVSNVEEILPATAKVPLWYSSCLSSISGTEKINNTEYNYIISFYSDINEVKQAGIIIVWYDVVTGESREASSTIFITREF